jgi:16S rRNA (guanine527-N7)-methyltransferase
MARTAFATDYDVPRETLARFDAFAALLTDWQSRMNLVGPSTLPDVWGRHFADSAQLLAIAGPGRSWLDIGAGAGFPGLVIALLDPAARLTLVESISKKCRFIAEASTQLGLDSQIKVENRRIETLPRQKFDIITARALASLDQLFDWALPYAGSGTRWVLPKGARVDNELAIATERFAFDYELVVSRTDAAGRIVVASGVKRR